MPKTLRYALVFLGAILFTALSIVVLIWPPQNPALQFVVYAIYALAATFFVLAIWLLVRLIKASSLKQRLRDAAHKTAFTARIYDDPAFRTVAIGYGSLLTSVFFALTKAATGIYYSSVWLCALAAYYLILCVTKALILRSGRKKVRNATGREALREEWKIYRLCGGLLLLLTSTLQGVIILIVRQNNTFSYRGTLIFVVALYDFYCLISSIVYMARTRKKHSPVLVSIKTISFATSLIAMLTLQTAMFASFSDGIALEMQMYMNIATGTAVCVTLILWGVQMLRRSQKELRKLREGEP